MSEMKTIKSDVSPLAPIDLLDGTEINKDYTNESFEIVEDLLIHNTKTYQSVYFQLKLERLKELFAAQVQR